MTKFDKKIEELKSAVDQSMIANIVEYSLQFHNIVEIEKSLGLSDYIFPVKGLFHDTLPQINCRFCFCLIDCDLRKSISFSAENLWPKLSSRGLMLFDDYKETEFKGAKLAVDEFITKYENSIMEHGLLERLYFVRKK